MLSMLSRPGLLVIRAGNRPRLEETLAFALAGIPLEAAAAGGPLPPLAGRRVLFALSVSETGLDADACALLTHLRANPRCMEGAVGAMLIDGEGELHTKQLAHMLALAANSAGCLFPGKPLVEATGGLHNWQVQAKRRGVSPQEAYRLAAKELAERLWAFEPPQTQAPRVLMLHASDRATSNTLALGNAVCRLLEPACAVRELSLQNGAVFDCRGCSYKTCSHFAAQNSCFYGGVIVKEIHPALVECDALLLLCPNYNDSVSANIMAFINRLTSLLVFNSLYDKYLFAVVVSGYSGSDLVAQQALGALCLNKTFMLPPRFCMMETANDPGSAMTAPGIDGRVAEFAQNMRRVLCGAHGAG